MSSKDILILVPALLASFCHGAVTCQRAYAHRRNFSIGRCFTARKQASPRSTTLERLRENEVEHRLKERVKKFVDVGSLAFVFYGLTFIAGTEGYSTFGQLQSVSAASFINLGIRLCPERFWRGPWLAFWYSLGMMPGCGILFFADSSNVYATMRMMGAIAFTRCVYSVTFCQVGAAAIMNSLLALVSLLSYARLEGDRERYGSFLDFAMWEILCLVVIVVLTWLGKKSLERECLYLLNFQSASTERSALMSLLGLTCDVVVSLDASLLVSDDSPTLSAILGIARDTRRLDLTQYMPQESDRERFTRRLSARSSSTGNRSDPGAMHSLLRDSLNNNFSVEIFFVPFNGPGESERFVVGIREVADQPLPPLRSGRHAHHDRKRRKRRPALGTPNVPQGGSLSGTDNSSHSSDSAGEPSLSESTPPSTSDLVAGQEEQRPELLDNRFSETSLAARKLSVLELGMHWNLVVPQDSCCTLHVRLKELSSVVRELKQNSACCTVEANLDCQCEACGWVASSKDFAGKAHCDGASMRLAVGLAATGHEGGLTSPIDHGPRRPAQVAPRFAVASVVSSGVQTESAYSGSALSSSETSLASPLSPSFEVGRSPLDRGDLATSSSCTGGPVGKAGHTRDGASSAIAAGMASAHAASAFAGGLEAAESSTRLTWASL